MLVIQGPVSLPGPLGGVWACRIAQRNSDGRYSDVELPWIVSSVMILADGQSVWEATAEPEDHGPWIVWHRFYEPGQHRITCRIFSGQSLAGQATLGVQVPVPGTP